MFLRASFMEFFFENLQFLTAFGILFRFLAGFTRM